MFVTDISCGALVFQLSGFVLLQFLTTHCSFGQFRFMMLSLAAMEAPLQLEIDGSTYGQDCVFVANDWHAALVPVYLASKYRPNGVYNNARSIIAIHNLRHQVRTSKKGHRSGQAFQCNKNASLVAEHLCGWPM
jgi:hypothetical protein